MQMHGRIAAQYSGDSVIGTWTRKNAGGLTSLTSRLTNIAYGGYTYVQEGPDEGQLRKSFERDCT
ncbi:uncharacterized protein CCOS01_13202 [Colletotrichum costaricense]|uniref:Uncharacterized protein n=1 Tax=Colletotrichum costaricense TaxID=1209916 RepID=A0AAI9YLI2_9PEZI|nr:uncharacterized protein CCOS01_13202 [Colletotrichum costaricense]KAK1515009.1 hypothetical protein CCOS01_13202 [Colletotrichum costaricense]